MTPEDKQCLTRLVLKALDNIEEEYGENASLLDAILVYDIEQDHGDRWEVRTTYQTSSNRKSVIVGLLEVAAKIAKDDIETFGDD